MKTVPTGVQQIPELRFLFDKYQEQGRIEMAQKFLEEALLPSWSQWLIGQREKGIWRIGGVYAASGVGKSRFSWQLIPMMLKLLKSNENDRQHLQSPLMLRYASGETFDWNKVVKQEDRNLLIEYLENAKFIYLDVRRNGDAVTSTEFPRVKSVSAMLGTRIARKFWNLGDYADLLEVVEKNISQFELSSVFTRIRHVLENRGKPSMLFVVVDEIQEATNIIVPKGLSETENLGRAFHRSFVSTISAFSKSSNFFVHGCLVGTAETKSSLSLDFTDNPIASIPIPWLPRNAVENLVRSNFPFGSDLLKSRFFLRMLTLAGGNSRLLESLYGVIQNLTKRERPLSSTNTIDSFQIDLLGKWIDFARARFSVHLSEWSTSTQKMALLLAMTGIPVSMEDKLTLKKIDPTGNEVVESLSFFTLETNGIIQRRALPLYDEWEQPKPWGTSEKHVLQISPLVAYMILDTLKSMIVGMFFFF